MHLKSIFILLIFLSVKIIAAQCNLDTAVTHQKGKELFNLWIDFRDEGKTYSINEANFIEEMTYVNHLVDYINSFNEDIIKIKCIYDICTQEITASYLRSKITESYIRSLFLRKSLRSLGTYFTDDQGKISEIYSKFYFFVDQYMSYLKSIKINNQQVLYFMIEEM